MGRILVDKKEIDFFYLLQGLELSATISFKSLEVKFEPARMPLYTVRAILQQAGLIKPAERQDRFALQDVPSLGVEYTFDDKGHLVFPTSQPAVGDVDIQLFPADLLTCTAVGRCRVPADPLNILPALRSGRDKVEGALEILIVFLGSRYSRPSTLPALAGTMLPRGKEGTMLFVSHDMESLSALVICVPKQTSAGDNIHIDEADLEKMARNGLLDLEKYMVKPPDIAMGRRVKNAVHWYAQGWRAESPTDSFISYCIVLDSLLGWDTPSLPSDTLTARVSERLAFLLSQEGSDRYQTWREVTHLIRLRGKIIHGSVAEAQPRDIESIERYARQAIVSVAKSHATSGETQYVKWFQLMKFGLQNNGQKKL